MLRVNHSLCSREIAQINPNQKPLLNKKEEITTHQAWHGNLSGMRCEEVLRGQPAGSYVLRQGESEDEYYLSWVVNTEKNIYRHQPFCIFKNLELAEWMYRNCVTVTTQTLEKIIPVMMGQMEEKCLPFIGNKLGN